MKKYKITQSAYSKQRRDGNRAWARELLGGKCAHCGATGRLEFDHIDPSTMCFRIGTYIGWSREKLLPELMKCQLLCRPCHTKKTNLETNRAHPIQHGTPGGYSNRKCKCDQCRRAWTTYITARKHAKLVT